MTDSAASTSLARTGDAPVHSSPLVCVLAYDRLCTFEFGIAVEVFGLPRPEFERWYKCEVVAVDDGPMRAMGGITVNADAGLARLADASLIVIPGWRSYDAPVPEALCEALRRASRKGARIATICSGVFVLAASGLLDGHRATTHWRYVDALKTAHPLIDVDGDVLYVDEGKLLTSAGSAAGLDLCLHIVRSDFGAEIANAVARRLVLPAHREGGQRQFVPRPVPKPRIGPIAPLLDRIRQSLNEDWPLERMAREAALSSRTLMRRMKEATGQSPQTWLVGERVAHAIGLLETTDASLDDIAAAAGFGSLETMRHHFRMAKGRPPSWYRTHFPTSDETPGLAAGPAEPARQGVRNRETV